MAGQDEFIKLFYAFMNTFMNFLFFFFHIRTVHVDIIKVLFIYSPTDTLVSCLKNNINI